LKQAFSIHSTNTDQHKSSPFKTKLKYGLLMASGWPALKVSFRTLKTLNAFIWGKMFGKRKIKYPNDTFKKACARHGVNEEKLVEIMAQIKGRKRLFWWCSFICIFFLIHSVFILSFNSFIMATLALLFSGIQVFNYSLRYWQCQNKKLTDANEFWADNGLQRMLKF